MPITARKLTLKGLEILQFPGAQNLDDVSRQEPDGIYDVTRLYPGCRSVHLDAHFDRLERSSSLVGMEIDLNRELLREHIRKIFDVSGYPEARLRICLPFEAPEEIYLVLEDFEVYGKKVAELKKSGTSVKTRKIMRQNPLAKTIQWVKERMQIEGSFSSKPYESIIVNENGDLLEGFSSNFYAVKGNKIFTSSVDVLPGIARKIVFEIAEPQFDMVDKPVRLDQFNQIDEAFLTSSSRGIIPIIQIDNAVISSGKPGEGTKQLMKAYKMWVDHNLELV